MARRISLVAEMDNDGQNVVDFAFPFVAVLTYSGVTVAMSRPSGAAYVRLWSRVGGGSAFDETQWTWCNEPPASGNQLILLPGSDCTPVVPVGWSFNVLFNWCVELVWDLVAAEATLTLTGRDAAGTVLHQEVYSIGVPVPTPPLDDHATVSLTVPSQRANPTLPWRSQVGGTLDSSFVYDGRTASASHAFTRDQTGADYDDLLTLPGNVVRGDNVVPMRGGREVLTRLDGTTVTARTRAHAGQSWSAPVAVDTVAANAPTPLSDAVHWAHVIRQVESDSRYSADLGQSFQVAVDDAPPAAVALPDRTDLIAFSHGIDDGLVVAVALSAGSLFAVPGELPDVELAAAGASAQAFIHQLSDGRWQIGAWDDGQVRDWLSSTLDGSSWDAGRDDELGDAAKLARLVFWCGRDGLQAVCGYDQAAGRYRIWCRPDYETAWAGPYLNAEGDEASPWCYQRPTGEWEAGWIASSQVRYVAPHPAGAWEVD